MKNLQKERRTKRALSALMSIGLISSGVLSMAYQVMAADPVNPFGDITGATSANDKLSYASNYFDAANSQGALYADLSSGLEGRVTSNGMSDSVCPASIKEISQDANDKRKYFCGDNASKSSWLRIANGAYYQNKKLDVVEYLWLSGTGNNNGGAQNSAVWAVNYTGYDADQTTVYRGLGVRVFSKDGTRYDGQYIVNREIHFYEHGTDNEVSFQGVVSFSDFEYWEGYRLKDSNYSGKAFLKYPNTLDATKGSISGVNYHQWLAPNPASGDVPDEEYNLYIEITSNKNNPLLLQYLVPRTGRASHTYVETKEVSYNIDGVFDSHSDVVDTNGTLNLTYTPDVQDGKTFDGWYSNSAMTNKITSLHVTADTTVYGKTVDAPADTYSITTSITGGTIFPTNPSNIASGSNQTISYNCNSGYSLNRVLVDGSAVSTASYPNSYTFSNITSNHTIAVTCTADTPTPTPDTYSITTSITGGTISPTNPSNIASGSNQTISYNCNSGYSLSRVLVDGSAVNITTYPTSYTFNNITSNHTIAVTCTADTPTPTPTPDPDPTPTPTPTPETITITTSIENGTITPSITNATEGDDVEIKYNCNNGYALRGIKVDGTALEELEPYAEGYTFEDVARSHEIAVTCASYSGKPGVPETGTITSNNSGSNGANIIPMIISAVVTASGFALLFRFIRRERMMSFNK